MDNMYFYEMGRNVPQDAQKQFNNGSFSGTDINPMWRIKMLTQMFGPAGLGWYYTIDEHWSEAVNEEITTHVTISLYVKYEGEWSKPIVGIGGNKTLQQFKSGAKVSDEGYKMALTDAISVAAKALGIGADVYWSADKTKYTASYTEKPKETEREKQATELLNGSKYTLSNLQKSSFKEYGKADINLLTEEEFTALMNKWRDALNGQN